MSICFSRYCFVDARLYPLFDSGHAAADNARSRRSRMKPLHFEGVFPILATPFDDKENLDLESFDRLVRFIGGLGVDGATILGGLREGNRLLDGERETPIRTPLAAAGVTPVIFRARHHRAPAGPAAFPVAPQN